MNIFIGILALLISTTAARDAPKIKIFEIRENENGLHLKNFNADAKSNPKAAPLAKLLRNPKQDNQAVRYAKQLLSQVKYVKEDDKANRLKEGAYIIVLNNDISKTSDETEEDTYFVDKTRNEKNAMESNSIKDLLLQFEELNSVRHHSQIIELFYRLPSENERRANFKPGTLRIPKKSLRTGQNDQGESRMPQRKQEFIYYDDDALTPRDYENQYNNIIK
ncbi:hypothetical protein HF086_003367 [Spodoptera exigua]|uniref:Uncharacterized protein n=1 Tax=Spodoptera exigua TaxID=7107 RepID=A0A922SSZ5_SPOEX|nr:hypothetical protein HF086_003367 [Spodoptera exigua]